MVSLADSLEDVRNKSPSAAYLSIDETLVEVLSDSFWLAVNVVSGFFKLDDDWSTNEVANEVLMLVVCCLWLLFKFPWVEKISNKSFSILDLKAEWLAETERLMKPSFWTGEGFADKLARRFFIIKQLKIIDYLEEKKQKIKK